MILKPLYKGKFGDILYLYGDAGIGKSRLIFEISKEIEKDITTYTLECEGILKRSLNPFIFLLNIYFEQANVRDKNEKEANFDDIFEELIENIGTIDREDKNETIEKLEKAEVFIKYLIGIKADSDLYEELEPEERFNNTIFAIKELVKAISLIKPLIIHIEDIHQIDEDSKKLIKMLIRNVEDYPFLIIGSGRFNDDGTKPSFLSDENIRSNEIVLEGLKEKDNVNIMIKHNMGYKADDELLSFLISRTNGNPFYLEQFCFHLHEAKQISLKDDKYTLVEKTERIPKSISSILTARIDRLPNALKEIVLIASVLGKEFNVKTLSEVLNNLNELLDRELITRQDFDFKTISTIIMNNSINELVKTGTKESLWEELSKLKYLFKYNLLVETAYNMQLKDRLHKLHKVIAESIEEIFSGESAHYFEIAYHYVKAEINYKAIIYLEKAGDYAKEIYDNQIALNSYQQLLKLLPKNNYGKILNIKYKLCEILEIIGKWHEATEILQKIVYNSENISNKKLFAKINLLYGKILTQKGDFKKAFEILQQTKNISKELEDDNIFGSALKNIGILYTNQAEFGKALDYFQQALNIFTKINEEIEKSNSLNAIGIIYANTSKIDKALEYFQQSHSSSELINHKQGISNSLSNIGRIYEIKGELDKALECQKKSLVIRDEIGYKKGISICLGSISEIHRLKKEYDKALKYQFDALSVFEEIGNQRGKALSLNIIGLTYKDCNKFDEALEYFTKALEIFHQIKDKKNIAFVIGNIGLIYFELGEYTKALDYQFKALEIKKVIGDKNSISYCLYSISEILYMKKDYENAMKYLKKAVDIKKLNEFDKNTDPEYCISFIYFYIALNDINNALKHILFYFENLKQSKKDNYYWLICLALAKILTHHPLNEEEDKLINSITKMTELEKKAEVYFNEIIEKTEKNNYSIVLISALLEYGKYLYLKKDDPDKALSMINRSKNIASEYRLKGRLIEIKSIIDEIINKKSKLGG